MTDFRTKYPGMAQWFQTPTTALSYCTETGVPKEFCMCSQCCQELIPEPPATLRAPIAEPDLAPEYCHLAYYGTQCNNEHCKDPVHLVKENPRW